MPEQFDDIIVSQFATSETYQDPVHKGIFKFQFMLSRSAPPLWVQIAKAEVREGSGINFCIQREASARSDRIVVRCSAEEAQRIKDVLNTDVLPNVNSEYRRKSGAVAAQKAAADAQQQAIMSDVQKAISEQK